MASWVTRLKVAFFNAPHTPLSSRELVHGVQRRMFTFLTTFIVFIMLSYAVVYTVKGDQRLAWLNVTAAGIGIACTAAGHKLQTFAWPMRIMMVAIFGMLTMTTLEQGPGLPAAGWWLSIVPFILAGAGLYRLAIAGVFGFIAVVSWIHFSPGAAPVEVEPWRRYTAVVGSETLALLVISVAMRSHTSVARALDDARTAAQEAASIKTGFLAHMSHEIRTPLTGIIGAAEVLASQDLSDGQRDQLLSLQRQSAGTLLALVNDVLDFAKLEAGKVQLESQPIDLRELAFESNELFSMQAFDKGVELSSSCARDVPARCFGDPLRLRQIVHNLVGNAVKFTERGEVHLDVALAKPPAPVAGAVPDTRTWVRITVTDTGPGISSEQQTHLFKPFIQLDGSATRRFGGTGLGLSISQDLAHLMDGHIDVESRVGCGSAFSLIVPLRGDARPGEVPTPQPRPEVVVATASPGLARHIESLLVRMDTVPTSLTRLPGAADLVSCRVLLVDAPLLPRVNTAGWLAEQEKAGRHVAVLTPLNADAVVGAPEGVHLVYKPVRAEALAAVLPYAVPAVGAPEAEPLPPTLPLSQLRVLVAEDNPVNQVVIQAMLLELGIACTLAENGRDALDAALARPFDVALMDVHMPEMDGLSATRELRAQERQQFKRPLHVIAMTARTEHDDELACLGAGMDSFLPKPFGLNQLRRGLELAAARQAAH
jgi:signal transduction histidine kinase/CheY-like chemotaxis protein